MDAQGDRNPVKQEGNIWTLTDLNFGSFIIRIFTKLNKRVSVFDIADNFVFSFSTAAFGYSHHLLSVLCIYTHMCI